MTTWLTELRRELEEILVLLSRDMRPPACPESTIPQPEVEHATSRTQRAETEPDALFDAALVVVTEFGKATPAMLQMWLSIDYARAARILGEFETRGLISPRGRVRHKAYELRRSRSTGSQLMEFRP